MSDTANDTAAAARRREIDAEAARLVVSLESTPDPLRERIAMDFAGQSHGHAIALARAERAWEAAGRLRAVTPGCCNAVVQQRTAGQEGVIELDGEMLEQAVAEFNRYRHAPIVLGD